MTASFHLDSQAGGTITNVGGDHHVHVARSNRAVRIGKTLALLGFALFVASLVLFGVLAFEAAQDVRAALDAGDLSAPYSQYVPAAWPAVVALLVSGIVIGRVGKVLAS